MAKSRAMTVGTPLEEKRQEVLRIAHKYGARRMRVCGSVARGEADAQSDVGFLVGLEAGRSLLDLGGLQFELESLLGRPVDVVTELGLKARIRERVLQEAVPVREIRKNDCATCWKRSEPSNDTYIAQKPPSSRTSYSRRGSFGISRLLGKLPGHSLRGAGVRTGYSLTEDSRYAQRASVPTLTLVAHGPPSRGWRWPRRAWGQHCGAPSSRGSPPPVRARS